MRFLARKFFAPGCRAGVHPRCIATGACAALLLACGVADANPSRDFDRGACLSIARMTALGAAEVDQMVAGFGPEAQLFAPAQCGVNLYRMTYQTVAPDGTPAVASGGVVVPTQCTGPFPLVEYNHGTWTTLGLLMSEPKMHTVQEVMGQFGGQGYAAVMPDYLGYGASSIAYHPYLHAASSADVTLDAVRAARNCLPAGTLDDHLFLTGTSEGGYVTMATHRAMEALGNGEFTISATVATSGPYALADSTEQMIRTNDGVPGYAWMQLQSYQHIYGDVYHLASEVFSRPYVDEPDFDKLLPNVESMAALTREGKLPRMLEGPFGLGLLTKGFTQDYLNKPDQPARQHALANDLRDFVPVAPLTVCFGDPDTFAQANALAAASWFQGQGVTIGQADVQNMAEYAAFIAQMGSKNYHSNVEAPACVAWAREFAFDPILHADSSARH